ncbi:MAG: class I SAM-dependent methyltransferase [Dehalococcoidia bacterium]|nr:class I SAM-dependent methyltransferase [Dehalococcoidia bacterium]
MTVAPAFMSFDRVAHVYDATRGMPPEASAAVGSGLAAILAAVAPLPRVLEVGVGTGRVAVPLAEHGARVCGLDISRGMLDRLRTKTRAVPVLLAEATRPPFRAGAFDAALFVHILHLVPDPEATIDAAIGAVRPGGMLIAGATRHEGGLSKAGGRLREIAEETLGRPLHQTGGRNFRAAQDFRDAMAARGVGVEEHELARWPVVESGGELLAEFEAQVHSWMWDIPAGLVPVVAERARPEVERLCGGLERQVEGTNVFLAMVARLA